jgi:FtsZ-binding cell division protein ZapB
LSKPRPTGPVNCGCADAERTYAELAAYCDELSMEIEQLREDLDTSRQARNSLIRANTQLQAELDSWRPVIENRRALADALGIPPEPTDD